jgi:cell division protein FtsX
MTRIKLVAIISTITAAMILGSTLVFASAPAADTSDTVADQPSISTDLQADPVKRGGGGSGKALKK